MANTPRNYEELRRQAQATEDAKAAEAETQSATEDAQPMRPDQVRKPPPGPAGPGYVDMSDWGQEQAKFNWEQRQKADAETTESEPEQVSVERQKMIDEAQSNNLPPPPDETDPNSPAKGHRR